MPTPNFSIPSNSIVAKQGALSPWTAIQHRTHTEDSKNKIRTLLIEHGAPFYDRIGLLLEKMGHMVYQPNKQMTVQEQLIAQMPHIVLLMTAFPYTQAIQTCVEIRQSSYIPLIMFTDSHQSDIVIQAYELGADAVISLPFTAKEVEMRIRAVMRRATQKVVRFSPPLVIGKIVVDELKHEVRVDNQIVELTPTDYRLLLYFMQNPNQVISKSALLKAIWENDITEGSNLVEVAIRRLRQKIEKNPSKPQYLLTVHGLGYKLIKPSNGY